MTQLKKDTEILLGLVDLPSEISISTMTVCCKLNIVFNVVNIAKYIELSCNDILSVSSGKIDNKSTNRSLLNLNKKKKKKKKAFFNQVTMNIYTKLKDKMKPVNLKLFSNGAMQITGCKNMDIVYDVLSKLFNKLKETKAIINKDTYTVEEKPYSSNSKLIDLKNITNMSISMINSNFQFDTRINRTLLAYILKKDNIPYKFNTSRHAGVNIKYYYSEDKKISILIFEEGRILITGAKNYDQICKAYEYINRYLLSNIDKIIKMKLPTKNKIMSLIRKNKKTK